MKSFVSKKVLASVLIIVMMFQIVAFAAGVGDTLGLTDQDKASQAYTTDDTSQIRISDKEKALQITNSLVPGMINQARSGGPEWLRRTDIQFSFMENLKPQFTLETIQPFFLAQDKIRSFFWQGRAAYQDTTGTTANFGLGYRWLTEDKQTLTGINTFYDHAYQHNHSRWGLGAEYFTNLLEFRTNGYFPVSGPREITRSLTTTTYEKALGGYDFEVGTSFSRARWLGVYAQSFCYDYKNSDDAVGYRLRATMQLTPRFLLEAGYVHDRKSENSTFVNVQYNLADSGKPVLWGQSKQEKEDKSKPETLESRILQKVERENNIRVETYTQALPTAAINVTIAGSNGQLLSGVVVEAYNTGGVVQSENHVFSPSTNNVPGTLMGSGTTDSSGHCLINGLPIGTYVLRAISGGTFVDSGRIQLNSGQNTVNLSITVPTGDANVTVQWNDTNHTLISGVQVQAIMNGNIAATVTTNASGIASFNGLAPGIYTFQAVSGGTTFPSTATTVAANQIAAATITFVGGSANVAVQCNDTNHTPVSGVQVQAKLNGNTVATATTNASGVASFNGLVLGSYIFQAVSNGTTYTSAATTITASQATNAMIIFVDGSANVSVYWNDINHTPVSGAQVQAVLNGNTVATATTNAGGVATFSVLMSGNYIFQAASNGTTYTSAATTVTVGQKANATITFIGGSANVTVQWNDNNHTPVSGVQVEAVLNGNAVATVTTNASGIANFSVLPPGSYTFQATISGTTSTSTATTVTAGQTPTATVTFPLGSATITVIADYNSTPVVGAHVQALQNGSYVGSMVTTGSDGKATINNLLPGTYNSFVAQYGSYSKGYGPVVVSPGNSSTATITMETGSANVIVMWNNDKVIQGATVQALCSGVGGSGITGPDGMVTIPGLVIGTGYTFRVTYNGVTQATYTGYTVNTGQNAVEVVRLPTGRVYVDVRWDDSNGISISNSSVQAMQNGTPVGPAVPGSVAYMSNLTPGDYTFVVTYKGVVRTSALTTIVSGYSQPEVPTIHVFYPSGKADVTVKSDTGTPIAGVTVVCYGYDVATSDANGVAHFTRLIDGSYTFKVIYQGQTINYGPFGIGVSQTTTIDLILPSPPN